MFGHSILGIDMGTAKTSVYEKDRGILAGGSSVIAIDADNRNVLAFGDHAKEMLGRTPDDVKAICPIQEGVIADYDYTVTLLKSYMKEAQRRLKLFAPSKPIVVIAMPVDTNTVQKKTLEEAVIASGAYRVCVCEGILAAGLGADLPVWEATGTAVLDIGAGKTEAAVLSLGGIVTSSSVKAAGNHMDANIQSYIRKKYNLAIGQHTAEFLKLQLGSAVRPTLPDVRRISGFDSTSGLPQWLDVSSDDIHEAIKGIVNQILQSVKGTLEKCPPELASDIGQNGIVLTGGGALLQHMDKLVSGETGVPVSIAKLPLESAVIGAARIGKNKSDPAKDRSPATLSYSAMSKR